MGTSRKQSGYDGVSAATVQAVKHKHELTGMTLKDATEFLRSKTPDSYVTAHAAKAAFKAAGIELGKTAGPSRLPTLARLVLELASSIDAPQLRETWTEDVQTLIDSCRSNDSEKPDDASV